VDIRVVDESWSELIVAAQGLHQSRWEDLLRNFDHLQCRVGRKRRWLDDDSIAHQHCRQHLSKGQDEREVPGTDRGSDTERHELVHNGFVLEVIFLTFWLLEVDMPLDEVGHSLDFPGAELSGLASLLEKKLSHFILVGFHGILEASEALLTVLPSCILPFCVSFVGGDDGFFNVLLSGHWNVPEWLLCCGVNTMVFLL
jgi:hypothetical protein